MIRLSAGVRVAVIGAAALLAIVAASFAFWFVFGRPRALQAEAGKAKVEAAGSAATAGAAQETIKLQVIRDHEIVRIDATTRENQDVIHQAPGADSVNPGVADALRRAVCMRAAHSADPACGAVRGPSRSIGDAGADTGSRAAGER